MPGSPLTGSLTDLRAWLTERIAEYLETDQAKVDPTASFESQGLDSMAALTLCDDVEDAMGLVLEPTLAWDHPTIDDLAEFLLKTAQTEAAK
jgi:acyl carrier protein